MAGAFTLQGFETPEEVQAKIGKAKQAEFRPQGDINSMIYQSAAQGASGQIGALGKAFGVEDPAIKQAKLLQKLMKDTDLSSSKSIYSAAKQLSEEGLTKQAMALQSKGNEVRKIEAGEVPDPAKLTRFKGLIDGEPVVAFSDGEGNTYARVKGQLVKNPPNLTEITTGKTEFDVGLGKKGQGDIEKKLIDAGDLSVRLDSIDAAYDKQFLTYGGKAESLYNRVKEKMGVELDKNEKDLIDRDTNMRQTVMDNMNTYIHDMSGAAVTVQEAKRLSKSLPTMEDSPTEFRRKLKNVKEQTAAKIARYKYWRVNGLIKKGMTDSQMNTLASKSEPARAYSILEQAKEAIKNNPSNKAKIIKELTRGFKADGYSTKLLKDL